MNGIYNILIITLLALATRGVFALWNDLKRITLIGDDKGDWGSSEGYKSEKEHPEKRWIGDKT